MATIRVRYLTERPGAAGELPRYFWQPSAKLRAEGWRMERVPLNWGDFTDPEQLLAAAVTRANELNEHLDSTRALNAVKATRPLAPSRTLGDLIRLYQGSKDFTGLAPSTQRGYRQCMKKLEDWGQDAPVRAIDTVRVQRLKEGLSTTPAFANAVVRVMRLLLAFGRREGWVTQNAAARPGQLTVNPAGLIWPREAVELFVQTADRLGYHSMGTAVLLNEWLGQRQGDILRMPRAALRFGGSTLVIRQSKGGRAKAGVSLPIGRVPRLAARLTEELQRLEYRDAQPGVATATNIIVFEGTGLPYQVDTFRHVFARIRKAAALITPAFEIDYLMPGRDMADQHAFQIGMLDLTFMHLRHTAVTRLAEAECDTTLISAITGHSQATVQQLMERYMVRTAQMASIAFQRRLDAETGDRPAVKREAGG